MNLQKHFIHMEGMTFQRLIRFFLPSSNSNRPKQYQVPKNTYLYSPTQKQTQFFLLQKGPVKVGTKINDNQHIQHIAWEGELFGEQILFGQNPTNGFAQALEEVKYYAIEVVVMQQFLQQNRLAQKMILEVFNKRLQAAQKRLLVLQTQDTRTRIIDFLLHIAKERGHKVAKHGYFVAPFFQQKDIAALIGCSLPAVGLVMRQLKKEGLVSYSSRQLRTYNVYKLKHLISIYT